MRMVPSARYYKWMLSIAAVASALGAVKALFEVGWVGFAVLGVGAVILAWAAWDTNYDL